MSDCPSVESPFIFAGVKLSTSCEHSFGLTIHGLESDAPADYLHEILLAPGVREQFWKLVEREKLIICKNIMTNHTTYRKVRGKSSKAKLSQAEYYHHDGCSCPMKPHVVEIRLPYQDIERTVATAIAPFSDVVVAMLQALPGSMAGNKEIQMLRASRLDWLGAKKQWDSVQGKITRLVRKEMDAVSCRAYFREVDRLANAYVVPWEMGESRFMLNNHVDLAETMQHRRAYQPADQTARQNGSLVKRWPAEELEAKA